MEFNNESIESYKSTLDLALNLISEMRDKSAEEKIKKFESLYNLLSERFPIE